MALFSLQGTRVVVSKITPEVTGALPEELVPPVVLVILLLVRLGSIQILQNPERMAINMYGTNP